MAYEMKTRQRGNADWRNRDDLGGCISLEFIPNNVDLQGFTVARRYGVTVVHARVVAELAFSCHGRR